MAKLFIITGHGAGDPGACGNGYQEAERVRALAQRIKALGGDDVMLSETNRNYYKDNGISKLTISKDYKIIELHMDSSADPNVKGAHVIIHGDFKADAYDEKLAEFITGIFEGRSNKIVGRTDLANPTRAKIKGYNYRLLECGFISNADDVNKFSSRMDEIAKGILSCFDIGVKESQKPVVTQPVTQTTTTEKSLDDWANEVIAGKHGTGHTNREASLKANGCTYDYQTVRNRVNELYGVKATTSAYYPKYTGNSYGIDTVFKAVGVPEKYCGNYRNRKPVAQANGITNYTGTASQNNSLVALAKKGMLKRV